MVRFAILGDAGFRPDGNNDAKAYAALIDADALLFTAFRRNLT